MVRPSDRACSVVWATGRRGALCSGFGVAQRGRFSTECRQTGIGGFREVRWCLGSPVGKKKGKVGRGCFGGE